MRNARLREFFLEQRVFATEKLDGTNVGKDEGGQLYGRRLLIGKQSESYQKTSLKRVKEAEIATLKTRVCERADIEEDMVQHFIVYGELMCNTRIYDYNERNLVAEWRVFGAMMEAAAGESEMFDKLTKSGFAVRKDCEERIRIFPCTAFFSLVTECGMEHVHVKSEGDTIAQIVSDNLEDMRRGKLEGIILTTPFYGRVKLVKWKGGQEYQPGAENFLKDVIEDIKSQDISSDLKTFYRNLGDVAFVGPDINPLVTNKMNRQEGISKPKPQKGNQSPKGKKNFYDQVSNDDKKLIVTGIYHSMNKFDDIETYIAKDDEGIDTYVKILQEESRKHYVEEKRIIDDLKDSDPVVQFIDSSVQKIVLKMCKIKT